jgi:DNA-binding protein HU-beta
MNKQDVIGLLAGQVDLSKKKTEEVIDGFLKLVVDQLAAGEKVQLFGFGNFEVSERAARNGVNPKTKEKIKIAASKGVKFKPAKNFKDAVKG